MGLFSKKKQRDACPMCGVTIDPATAMRHADAHVRPEQTAIGQRYSWDCCGGPGGSWEQDGPAAAGLAMHWMQVHGIDPF